MGQKMGIDYALGFVVPPIGQASDSAHVSGAVLSSSPSTTSIKNDAGYGDDAPDLDGVLSSSHEQQAQSRRLRGRYDDGKEDEENMALSWHLLMSHLRDIFSQSKPARLIHECQCVSHPAPGSDPSKIQPKLVKLVTLDTLATAPIMSCRAHLLHLLLIHGYFPASPKRPKVAFSFRLLVHVQELTNVCGIGSEAFASALDAIFRREQLKPRDQTWRTASDRMRKQVSAAATWHAVATMYAREATFGSIIWKPERRPLQSDRLHVTLADLISSCPACFARFGESDPLPSAEKPEVIISVDGNFSLRRRSSKSTAVEPRQPFPPRRFLADDQVSEAAVTCVTVPSDTHSGCQSHIKVADEKAVKASVGHYDVTGVMDGEGMERVWSRLNNLVSITRSMTKGLRRHTLEQRADYLAQEALRSMFKKLASKERRLHRAWSQARQASTSLEACDIITSLFDERCGRYKLALVDAACILPLTAAGLADKQARMAWCLLQERIRSAKGQSSLDREEEDPGAGEPWSDADEDSNSDDEQFLDQEPRRPPADVVKEAQPLYVSLAAIRGDTSKRRGRGQTHDGTRITQQHKLSIKNERARAKKRFARLIEVLEQYPRYSARFPDLSVDELYDEITFRTVGTMADRMSASFAWWAEVAVSTVLDGLDELLRIAEERGELGRLALERQAASDWIKNRLRTIQGANADHPQFREQEDSALFLHRQWLGWTPGPLHWVSNSGYRADTPFLLQKLGDDDKKPGQDDNDPQEGESDEDPLLAMADGTSDGSSDSGADEETMSIMLAVADEEE
ncbi:hypothetical protein OC834_006077 [Tilletia horrida]|nr:hypothetical protein OC834_006077 [Tilletia horrida]